MKFKDRREVEYRGCKIIIRECERENAHKDILRSFEAQDENGKTLWISDIMYECDYLQECKDVIDKHMVTTQ